MPVNTDKQSQTSITTNEPSKFQNEGWGGLWGAYAGLTWPGGNFADTPMYPGQFNAPQGQQTTDWYNTVNNMRTPDYSGVMQGSLDLKSQAEAGIRNPGDVNFSNTFQNQNFQVNPLQFNDPFAGYNGGGPGMQVQAPGGINSSYNTAWDKVSAPQGVQAQMIGNIPQLQGPNLNYFQAQGPQQVNAPNLKDFQMQAAADIAPQAQVGTEDWRSGDTASSFMSPYMQNVVDTEKGQAQRDYDEQITNLHSNAAKAGAFGGSRQAVVDAEANRDLQNRMAGIQAQGTQQAYQQGQQQFNQQQQLGLQGQQFNVQSGMQAALANQANQQQANTQNLSSFLQTQGLGAQTGLQAGMANQQAGVQTNLANLQANTGTQALGANLGMQAQQGNQNMSYQQQAANQQAGLQAGMFNNTQNLQAQGMNQSTGLQANMQDTNLGYQAGVANAGLNLQAQGMNQQAQQNQFQRQYGAMGQQGNWGMQGGINTQNLGMTAQQLAMQNNQFGAGLNLQTQQGQEQARNAIQNANLGYLNFGGNMMNQMGNMQNMGFQNEAQRAGLQANAGVNEQNNLQANANRSYQDWLRQIAYPQQQLQFGANLMSMMPAQGTTQSVQQGVKYQYTPDPSVLNQAAGAAGTFVGAAAAAAAAKGGLMEEPDAQYAMGGLAYA